jgi:hypothetical protein
MNGSGGGNGGNGGGLGSATGHPAPNAGTVGSWLTLNLKDKKRGKADRVAVTKSASFMAGAASHLKALPVADKIMGGIGVAAGILSIVDLMRSTGLEKNREAVREAISSGKRVNSKQFVKKIDPKIVVLTNEQEILRELKGEMSGWRLKMLAKQLSAHLSAGSNAFAIPGKRRGYVIAPSTTNAEVLAHEVGHIIDFRKRNINIDNMGPYAPSFLMPYLKDTYDEKVMEREREAWRQAPGRKEPTPLEQHALGTYEKGFHRQRGFISGMTAAFLVPALLKKVAYGRNSSVGPTGDRDGPQTAGEQGVEQGASGVGATRHSPSNPMTTRKSGNQGSRGVPEWARLLKHTRSPATRNGGDKVGPQKSDKQMYTPKQQPGGTSS